MLDVAAGLSTRVSKQQYVVELRRFASNAVWLHVIKSSFLFHRLGSALEVTAASFFANDLQIGVGTGRGQVLVYDIRASQPVGFRCFCFSSITVSTVRLTPLFLNFFIDDSS